MSVPARLYTVAIANVAPHEVLDALTDAHVLATVAPGFGTTDKWRQEPSVTVTTTDPRVLGVVQTLLAARGEECAFIAVTTAQNAFLLYSDGAREAV